MIYSLRIHGREQGSSMTLLDTSVERCHYSRCEQPGRLPAAERVAITMPYGSYRLNDAFVSLLPSTDLIQELQTHNVNFLSDFIPLFL